MSLNIPLSDIRIGSLSTKTTHPVYMSELQEIWNTVGIDIDLVLPYQYKTKGEVLKDCTDQKLLMQTVFKSTSCGKFQRHGLRHCGVCVPCLVRRAAFLRAGMQDDTHKGYCVNNLKNSESPDVAAAAAAVAYSERFGFDSVVKSCLSFVHGDERRAFADLFARGISELAVLLRDQGVL